MTQKVHNTLRNIISSNNAFCNSLKQGQINIDDNIFRSLKNANIDALLGYRENGTLHSFLEDYFLFC